MSVTNLSLLTFKNSVAEKRDIVTSIREILATASVDYRNAFNQI